MLELPQMTPEQQEAYMEGIAAGSVALRSCRVPRKVDPMDFAPEYAKRPTLKAACWKKGFVRNFNFWAAKRGWPTEFLIPLIFTVPTEPD